jgi:hypothetical protein
MGTLKKSIVSKFSTHIGALLRGATVMVVAGLRKQTDQAWHQGQRAGHR